VNRSFTWILEDAVSVGCLSPKAVFNDGTHIKAGANTKKQIKAVIPVASQRYAQERISKVMHTGRHTTRSRLRMKNRRLRRRKNGGTHLRKEAAPPEKGENLHWRLSWRLKSWWQILPARHPLVCKKVFDDEGRP
jgi:hypothetical protein